MTTPLPDANIAPSPVWAMMSPIGRLGREPYWLCLALIWLVVAIATNVWLRSLAVLPEPDPESILEALKGAPAFSVLFIVMTWFMLALVIKRLQDIGQSGFLALLIFVPIVRELMLIGLGFVPSKPEPNNHGPLPNSHWRSS